MSRRPNKLAATRTIGLYPHASYHADYISYRGEDIGPFCSGLPHGRYRLQFYSHRNDFSDGSTWWVMQVLFDPWRVARLFLNSVTRRVCNGALKRLRLDTLPAGVYFIKVTEVFV